MQYETLEGLCAVVPATAATATGRLQQFVARSFREELGRQSGAMHVNVRSVAAVACQLGYVLVDGQVAQGRRTLHGGELVLLKREALGMEVEHQGVPRMLMHVPQGGCGETSLGENGQDHFRRYYRDIQHLATDWEECEKLFLTPVPLSLRINRTSRAHHTMQMLNETFGDRAETG